MIIEDRDRLGPDGPPLNVITRLQADTRFFAASPILADRASPARQPNDQVQKRIMSGLGGPGGANAGSTDNDALGPKPL